jgi:hypothetical protein
MARIVTSTYRYKRPPPKKKPAAALEGPAIITIRDKKRATVEAGAGEDSGSAGPTCASRVHAACHRASQIRDSDHPAEAGEDPSARPAAGDAGGAQAPRQWRRCHVPKFKRLIAAAVKNRP